jgi:hypothetical protein
MPGIQLAVRRVQPLLDITNLKSEIKNLQRRSLHGT